MTSVVEMDEEKLSNEKQQLIEEEVDVDSKQPIIQNDEEKHVKLIQHRVYPIRWLMLLALIVLNISNGMMWLSFSPVPSVTANFYHITLSQVDWFSQSYFVASLVVGFIAIAILDVFGLRLSVFIGVALNLFGAILRYISTLNPVVCSSVFSGSGYMVAIIGQLFTACAQPFFLYAPAKLANTWFGPNQRAFCTLLASIANPVGIAAAQLMSPHIATDTTKIPMLMWIYIIPAGIGALLSIVYYKDRPPVPPTNSGDYKQEKFFKGVKDTLRNWNFIVLLTAWGVAAGMFNALQIVIPQYLCPFGYSNQSVGLWGSLMIFSGLLGGLVSGLVIDSTKKFKETGVVCLTLALVCLIWFVEVATIPNNPVLVAIPLCLVGFFGMSILPVSMEMGVELTYPVAEATSSGLLWSAAQIFGIIFVSIGQLLVVDLPTNGLSSNKCGVGLDASADHSYCSGRNITIDTDSSAKPGDWTYAGIMFILATFFGFVMFTLFLHPKYKRLEKESEANRKQEETSTN